VNDDSGDFGFHAPRWRDGHGVVHIAGTHSYNRVLAECGWVIAAGGLVGHTWPPYEDTVEVPTCLMCIGSEINPDTLPWASHETVGMGVIDVSAILKISFKL
jgi:hypothetical protein